MAFDFEKLDVYKKAINLAGKVYKMTKNFPESERYGLQGQFGRAAVSIASNIAEGKGRYNKKDFAQFLRIARGSAYECVPLVQISHREGYLTNSIYEELLNDCNEVAKMINGLISSLISE